MGIAIHILRKWLDDVYGIFSLEQVYTDLGVKDEKDKSTIRVALSREVKDGRLEKGERWGYYKKVDIECDDIPILDHIPKPLPLILPADLQERVNIYPGNILIDCGSPNAGKTAYDLNFAYLNRDRFEIIYWSSEMDAEELKIRLMKFKQPMEEWKKIKFKKRVQDFHQVIHPDAINIIDYLEVIDGEFYKVGDQIRKIYERLSGKGIALISLQMDPKKKYGWGGNKTRDKARLYFTLDQHKLTISKAKNQCEESTDRDFNDAYRSYKITCGGSKFEWGPWITKD